MTAPFDTTALRRATDIQIYGETISDIYLCSLAPTHSEASFSHGAHRA